MAGSSTYTNRTLLKSLDADFSDDEVETVGGLLLQEIGLVSDLQGQVIDLENWEFTIVEADARSIHLIRAVRK